MQLPQVVVMSEEMLKFYCINVHLKLNSDLHETYLYEELNLFLKS